MVSKDTLYAEAEAVFRKFFAENIRISRAGGLREATPVLLETATGFFLEDVLNQYRKQADEGSRAQGSDPVIKAISRLPGHSKSGSLIALSTCVDASGWSFFIGKEFRSKGVPARDEIYFSHSDGLLRMIGAFGQGAGNALAAMLGVDCDIGDQINTLMIISKWDKAGIANDPSIFLPDIARQRQGRGFSGAVRPLQKRIVLACAAHILHISFALIVHCA